MLLWTWRLGKVGLSGNLDTCYLSFGFAKYLLIPPSEQVLVKNNMPLATWRSATMSLFMYIIICFFLEFQIEDRKKARPPIFWVNFLLPEHWSGSRQGVCVLNSWHVWYSWRDRDDSDPFVSRLETKHTWAPLSRARQLQVLTGSLGFLESETLPPDTSPTLTVPSF